MFRRLVTLVSLLAAFVIVATIAPRAGLAQNRIALVLGNSAYRTLGFASTPANDAAAMGDLFKAARFDDVRIADDLTLLDMKRELRAFSEKAGGADIAVIFFAGRGMEIGGQNYLLPIDASLARDLDAENEALDLDRVLQSLEPAKLLKLVILDASRDNPFALKMKRTRPSLTIGRGLGPPKLRTSDTLVAYAARAGAVASDGDGAHSPFTTSLLHHLTTPGLDVRMALGNVHGEVLQITHGEQEPVVFATMMRGTISLVPKKAEPPQPRYDPEAIALEDFGRTLRIGTPAAWDTFLAKHPTGLWAERGRIERQKLVEAWQPGEPSQQALLPPPAIKLDRSAPCGGAVLTPSRARTPLSAQEECALKLTDVFKECDKCPEMLVIPPGSFIMGSPANEAGRNDDEGPQHRVTIAQPFAVAKFDVTVDDFAAFVADTGYDAGSYCNVWSGRDWEKSQGLSWRNPGYEQTGMHPVTCVSWYDAQAYVDWLKGKTGKQYRLLSESEWEYAARGQTSPPPLLTSGCGCEFSAPPYFFGNDDRDMCRYGNGLDRNGKQKIRGMQRWAFFPCSDGYAHTSPVGIFLPNPFGLYDMLGNVWQWTQDCYVETYGDAPIDGSAETSVECRLRVRRGGSWSSVPWHLRIAMRIKDIPDGRNDSSGIRVARTIVR
jgi:formylglycine-generating enzyme required for sulfatase activity